MFRNFKNIENSTYGKGSFNKLGEILVPHRMDGEKYMVFFVDEYGDYESEFKTIVAQHTIEIPANQTANWNEEIIDDKVEVGFNLDHL